jgi:hypothetical protein
MPNIHGQDPKRAILYAHASTDEQARSGYSLAQQIEADLYRATPGAWLHPRDRRAAPKRR